MSLRKIIVALSFVMLLLPASSFAASLAQTLDTEYVNKGNGSDIAFRIQPPKGWTFDTRGDSDGFVGSDLAQPAALVFTREIDEGGKWKDFQKMMRILSGAQLQQLFKEIVPGWNDPKMKMGKIKTSVKIDGKMQGMSVEFIKTEGSFLVYGKVTLFGKGGYIYSAGTTAIGAKSWKKYKDIMDKSINTLRILQ